MIKKGAKASIRKSVTRQVKNGKPVTVERDVKINLPMAEMLIGDGNAAVSRTRTLKTSLPYGEASISASCTVTLTCNQDNDTIQKAAALCIQIIESIMKEDQSEMAAFMEVMKK